MAWSRPAPARWPALALFGIVSLFGAIDWQLYSTNLDTSPIAASTANTPISAQSSDPGSPPPKIAARQPLVETLARPLFRADRRPYVPKPVAAASAPEPPPVEAPPPAADPPPPPPPQAAPLPAGLKLVGIVTGADGERRAVLRIEEGRSALTYALRAHIGSWTLSEIDESSVTFKANGEKTRLELYAGGKSDVREQPGDAASSTGGAVAPDAGPQ